MAEPNLPSKPLTSFHLFSLLPTELRLNIWEFAYLQPRLLTLEFDRCDTTTDYIIDRTSNPQAPSWFDFWANDKLTAGFIPLREGSENIPLIPYANRESWEITRELNDVCFATRVPKGAVVYRWNALAADEDGIDVVPHADITRPGFQFRPTYDTVYLQSLQTTGNAQHTPLRHALVDEVKMHTIQRLAFNIGLGESEAATNLHIWGFDQYKNLKDFIFVIEIENRDRLREQLESLLRLGHGWPGFEDPDEHSINTSRRFPRTRNSNDTELIFTHFKTYLLKHLNTTILSYNLNRRPGEDLDRSNGEPLGTSMARHQALLNQPRTYKLMTRTMLEDYSTGNRDVVPILELRNRPGYLELFSEDILDQEGVVGIAGLPEVPISD